MTSQDLILEYFELQKQLREINSVTSFIKHLGLIDRRCYNYWTKNGKIPRDKRFSMAVLLRMFHKKNKNIIEKMDQTIKAMEVNNE